MLYSASLVSCAQHAGDRTLSNTETIDEDDQLMLRCCRQFEETSVREDDVVKREDGE